MTYPVIKPIRKLESNTEENYNSYKENYRDNGNQELSKNKNRNLLRKSTEEKKRQRLIEKIKRNSSKKIRPKKITLELKKENYDG